MPPQPQQLQQDPENQNRPHHSADLIRAAPTPSPTDTSPLAQVIRLAQSPACAHQPYTFSAHYAILCISLRHTLIAEINKKLAQNLAPRPLMRSISPDQVDPAYHAHVAFAKTYGQREIEWQWCVEHVEAMGRMDPRREKEEGEMGLEELEGLVKMVGAWNVGMFKVRKREREREEREESEGTVRETAEAMMSGVSWRPAAAAERRLEAEIKDVKERAWEVLGEVLEVLSGTGWRGGE